MFADVLPIPRGFAIPRWRTDFLRCFNFWLVLKFHFSFLPHIVIVITYFYDPLILSLGIMFVDIRLIILNSLQGVTSGLAYIRSISDTGRLSKEVSDLVARQRKLIMKELHTMYSKRGLTEYAPRLGELFCLLTNEKVFQKSTKNHFVEKEWKK